MNKPTDAEIDAVLCNHWPAFSMQATLVRMWLRDAMRASLDKWGQPAHGGEPVARLEIGKTKGGVSLTHIAEPAAFQLPEGMYSLYLAPQPVEREPLTDEVVDLLCKVGPVYVLDGKVTRTPAQYRDELKAAQRYGLRQGERAHGIGETP